MNFEELGISGAWVANSSTFRDERGTFREWFKLDEFSNVSNIGFKIAQANTSTSSKGTIRGIHYSVAERGQAKWVTCLHGSIRDVIVDLRVDSATYGEWVAIDLSPDTGNAVYIGEGLGHGFAALDQDSTVAYLLSSNYSPKDEFGIQPLDPQLSIKWGIQPDQILISGKDAEAPLFASHVKAAK